MLDKIIEDYSAKMMQLYLYQRAMQDLAKQELRKLNEEQLLLKNNPARQDISYTFHNMSFRRAQDGQLCFFGYKQLSVEERRLFIVLHKNKQYQWLLSEAYEAFEDCLEQLYAYAAYKNNDFWPLSDFGNISLKELSGKSFEWFVEQASKKKDIPSSIINTFRSAYSEILNIEQNNALKINLYLAITLVQFLRHIIVHNSGVVRNKDVFKDRVLKKCGLYNSGRPLQEHVNFITQFFGVGEYENTIVLNEIPVYPELPVETYINVFEWLGGYLMAYIETIANSLKVQDDVEKL